MNLTWSVGKREAREVASFVNAHRHDAFVRARVDRNVKGRRDPLTKAMVWYHLASCLLTTQQRSGPTSRVQAFVSTKPFPLRYGRIREVADIEKFAAKTIRSAGGLRRSEMIARELAENAIWFEGAAWGELRRRLEALPGSRTYIHEREVARWVAERFRGLGPKQSRNFLQSMGLTRFETPIDSRVIKWLNDGHFPVHLSAVGLSDPDYYEFVSDGFKALARAAGVLPCVLDAAVFAATDGDGWSKVDVIV